MNPSTTSSITPQLGMLASLLSGNIEHKQDLEVIIRLAEVEAVTQDNPAPHFLLANLYSQLPTELSDVTKKEIELQKLRANNKEYLVDMPYDSREIIAQMGPEPTIAKRMRAATDYLQRANMNNYLSMNNVQRAIDQLCKGIVKSEDEPETYKQVLNNTLALFLIDERFHASLWYVHLCLEHHRTGYLPSQKKQD